MQTSIGAFFEEELGKVAGWDKVVSLRMEGRCAVLTVVSGLALVQTGLSVIGASFFADPESSSFPVCSLPILGALANLTAVDVVELVRIRLLHIACILVCI